MNLPQSVQTCLTGFADFSGEASRSEYWWFYGFSTVLVSVLCLIKPLLGGIAMLVLLVPLLAVTTRRLHDTNRSGWWQLVNFVPVIGWLILTFFLVLPGNSDGEA